MNHCFRCKKSITQRAKHCYPCSVLLKKIPLENRFNKYKQILKNGCWNWTGYRLPTGYGLISVNRKQVYIHRCSYEFYKGKIPEGLVIDHLCRNTSCFNPEHLEAVTMKENLYRGNAPVILHSVRKNQCFKGHKYTKKNTRYYAGKRVCKKCSQTRNQLFKDKNPSYHKDWWKNYYKKRREIKAKMTNGRKENN